MATNPLGSRAELRNFLRAARARIDPAQVGIPHSPRRRGKPGLRVEDLCSIAGVGLTWYGALEAGKPVSVSRRLLDAIADALRLNDDERHYLFALVEYKEPERAPDTSVRQTLARVVREIDLGPSMLVDECWNVIASNTLADYVYDLQSPAQSPNLLERTFLDDTYRTLHLEWEFVARALVASLKMNYAHARSRTDVEAFVARMSQKSREFRDVWDKPVVSELRPKVMELDHPTLGRLCLESIGLDQSERWRAHADDTILVQVPVPGTGTREALDRARAILR